MKEFLKYFLILPGLLMANFFQTGFCQGWDNGQTDGLLKEIHESIILQTDRTLYAAGEEIWFSASCFINRKEPETLLSCVLYIELFGQYSESIQKGKFVMDENGCRGSFLIPDETRSGVYYLRAYTAFMRNFAVEDFFTTPVTIVNPQLPADLVNIQNQKIEVVTENAGLKKIPVIENPAFSFSTSWDNENLVYEMFGKPPVESVLSLVTYSAGYREMISVKPKSITHKTTFVVPHEKLAPGLNFLALKDDRQQIIRLSIIYNFKSNPFELPVNTNKTKYTCREKVEVNVGNVENSQIQEATVFSVVVAKKGTMVFSSENSITEAHIDNPILFSAFLLQGNYNGKPDDDLIQAICMLQSARLNIENFDNLVKKYQNPTLEFLPEIRGITISGMVRDKNTNLPAEGLPWYSSVLFGNPQVNIYKTGSDGRFVFPMHLAEGVQDVFLSTAPFKEIVPELMVNQDFSTTYPDLQPVSFPFDSTGASFLKEIVFNSLINSTFEPTLVNERKKEKSSPIYFGEEKKVVYLDDYISLKNMKEVFTEIIPVVKVRKSGNKHKLIVTDDHANFLPGTPLLMVDNMPVFDADKVLQIHPSQVEKIEVINKVYVLGDWAIIGIIMIFTKTDNFGGIERPAQSIFAEFQTITPEKCFASPVYSSEKEYKSPMPDFRNVLFWNSDMVILPLGNTVNFYTSDSPGDYEIIVRGFLKDGTPVSGRAGFSVSR